MSHVSRSDGVIRRPETKSFVLTSEFWVAAGAAAAVFLAGYALDDIARTTAWRYGVWIAIAYIISRGIAKAGSQRDYRPEPSVARRSGEFWRDDRREQEPASFERRQDALVTEPSRSNGEPAQVPTSAP
jgi:hypothetical protein